MFLRYLSDKDYDERYWAFILRFETLVNGVATEAAKRMENLTDEQASDFFANAFACALDVNSGVTPPGWWDNMSVPTIDWFHEYMANETPYMIKEARRLALLAKAPTIMSEANGDDPFDREKIRRLAHSNSEFQKFLFRVPRK